MGCYFTLPFELGDVEPDAVESQYEQRDYARNLGPSGFHKSSWNPAPNTLAILPA